MFTLFRASDSDLSAFLSSWSGDLCRLGSWENRDRGHKAHLCPGSVSPASSGVRPVPPFLCKGVGSVGEEGARPREKEADVSRRTRGASAVCLWDRRAKELRGSDMGETDKAVAQGAQWGAGGLEAGTRVSRGTDCWRAWLGSES